MHQSLKIIIFADNSIGIFVNKLRMKEKKPDLNWTSRWKVP